MQFLVLMLSLRKPLHRQQIVNNQAESYRAQCYEYKRGLTPFVPGSLAAAVEEMPAGYDQLMIPVIENLPVLIIVLIITLPVAMLAIRLAERSMRKQIESFK